MAPRILPLLVLPFLAMAACSSDAVRLPAGDAARGRAVFVEMQCHACHRVQGDESLPDPVVHPPVHTVLGGTTTAWRDVGTIATDIAQPSLGLALMEPAPAGADGRSRMPDYSGRLTVRQLADVSTYVASTYTRIPAHRW